MNKKQSYKIPFSKHTGAMISYDYCKAGEQQDNENIEYKENYVFKDDLKYISYRGGRSSMSMILKSLRDGREYVMFWCYFSACIRRDNNSPGPVFHGKWTFIKTGQNYSVKPAEDEGDGV